MNTTAMNDSEPLVRDYLAVQTDPDSFSAPEKNGILREYFALQERDLRPVAAAAADEQLRALLDTLVDGLADRARDTTATKPAADPPAQVQVIKTCALPGAVVRSPER
ncbi:hypothetical protein [Actinoplanes sp. URMC 104]|uniref:hypothetical protein n=1 Tax=Actinoplanes sp. URMC 104 TaxID=3423409 RepID=UPI003F1BC601